MKRVLSIIAVLALAVSIPSGFAADFNGDGYDDIAIYRPADGLWAIRGQGRYYFGTDGDIPVPGKFVSSSHDSIAIYRPSTGLWAARDGGSRYYFGGEAGDVPIGACSSSGGGGSLWSQNGSNIYFNTGRVGIGMAAPAGILDVSGNSSIGTPTIMLYESSAADYARLSFENSCGDFFTLAGMPNATTANARMHIYYNETGNLMSFTGDGKVGIGTDDPVNALDIRTNQAGNYALRLFNDGNNANRSGLRIQSGSDTGVGTNYLVWFADGDNDPVGSITFTGGNVSYNTFTAEHNAAIPREDNKKGYPYGTVVSLCAKHSNPDRPRQDDYDVRPSSKSYDRAVFGIYAGKRPDGENNHSIYAIGDGHILVTKEGGDIGVGDYLTTSSKSGHAMKQDDDLRHNYTVAKALEAVDWENEASASKLIGCTYQTQ